MNWFSFLPTTINIFVRSLYYRRLIYPCVHEYIAAPVLAGPASRWVGLPPYGLLDFVFFSCYIMRMLVMDRSPRVSSRASVCTLTCFSHASSVWAMLMAHHYIIAARVCSAMQPQCRRRLLVIFLLSYSLSFSCVSSPTKQNKKTIYTVAYTVYRRRSAPFILFPIYDGRGKVSPTCLESVFFLFRLYSLLRYL